MTFTEWMDQAGALAEAATEGPWVSDWETDPFTYNPCVLSGVASIADAGPEQWVAECSPEHENGRADAAFIAAARTLVPQLIAALRAVEAECARADENYGHDAGVTTSDAIRSARDVALGVGGDEA